MNHRLTPILVLVIAVGAIFGRVVTHDFTGWDDPGTIYSNPDLNPTTASSLLKCWTHSEAGLYIPVTRTLWWMIASISPRSTDGMLAAWPFHLASLLSHMISATAVFQILRQLTGNPTAALLGALLFALHPLQVEPVAWTSGLKDLLAGEFGFVSVALWLTEPQTRKTYVASIVLFLLAALCKPSAIVFVGLIASIDVVLRRRNLRDAFVRLIPMLCIALVIGMIASHVHTVQDWLRVPFMHRPQIAADAITFYVAKLALPLNLAIDYGHTPATVMASHSWKLWAVPMACIAVIIASRRRAPIAIAAIFLVTLAPVLGFLPFQFQYYSTVADHYMYVPLYAAALATSTLLSTYRRVPTLRSTVVLGIATCALLSYLQVTTWRDSVSLFTQAARVNDRSAPAHNNLGNALAAKHDFVGAAGHYSRAAELDPFDPSPHRSLSQLLAESGNTDDAITHLAESIRLRRSTHDETGRDEVLLARMLISRHRVAEADAYLDDFLVKHPNDPEALVLLKR